MSVNYSRGPLSFNYVERTGNDDPGLSPLESFSRDGSKATKVIDIVDFQEGPNALSGWYKRREAAHAILGWSEKGNAAGTIKRYSPMPHADWVVNCRTLDPLGMTGQPFLYAQEISRIEGIGARTDGEHKTTTTEWDVGPATSQYARARMTVVFAMTPYRIAPSNGDESDESDWKKWVTLDYRVSGQYLTIPRGCMKFVSGPSAQKPAALHGISVGKTVALSDIRVTWHTVPYGAVPSLLVNKSLAAPGALDTSLGTVNSAELNGFPAGTLLLNGAAIRGFRNAFGDYYYDIEYAFSHNVKNHNFVPYVTSAGTTFAWAEVSIDGGTHAASATGKHIYDGAEHKSLFRAP